MLCEVCVFQDSIAVFLQFSSVGSRDSYFHPVK